MSLIHYWKLDGSTDNAVGALTLGLDNFSVTDPTPEQLPQYITGLLGQGVEFSEAGHIARLEGGTILEPPYTFVFWWKETSGLGITGAGSFGDIFYSQITHGGNNFSSFWLTANAGDPVVYDFELEGPDGYEYTTYTPIAGWNMVALVVDEASSKVYHNGALALSMAAPMDFPLSHIAHFCQFGSTGSNPFGFALDEVALFGEALTESDIGKIWNGGAGVDLIAAFLMDFWTDEIDPATDTRYFVLDIVDNAGALPTLRIPISSWQATLRAPPQSSFAQAVIPAASDWVPQIAAIANADFIISGGVRFADGSTRETQIVRSPLQQLPFDEGPRRKTARVIGYKVMDAAPVLTRTLQNVRSRSNTPTLRIRAALDFFLRPGQTAVAGSDSITVEWVNLYAVESDAFMDVGEVGAN